MAVSSNTQKPLELAFGMGGAIADMLEAEIKAHGNTTVEEYALAIADKKSDKHKDVGEALALLKDPQDPTNYKGDAQGISHREQIFSAKETVNRAAHSMLADRNDGKDIHEKTQLRISSAVEVLERLPVDALINKEITREMLDNLKTVVVKPKNVFNFVADTVSTTGVFGQTAKEIGKKNLSGVTSAVRKGAYHADQRNYNLI